MTGINFSALNVHALLLFLELFNIQLKLLHVYFTYVSCCGFFQNLCFMSRWNKKNGTLMTGDIYVMFWKTFWKHEKKIRISLERNSKWYRFIVANSLHFKRKHVIFTLKFTFMYEKINHVHDKNHRFLVVWPWIYLGNILCINKNAEREE